VRIRKARVAVLGVVAVLAAAGGIAALTAGGDPQPTLEAGSRFGASDRERAGGTLLDALAPVLGTRSAPRPRRGGADAAPPTAQALGQAPADAVAGLFLVGFRGTEPRSSFFDRLRVRPYGGVLLTDRNYVAPQQLATLAGEIQVVARQAGHPAPLVAAAQEGGELNAFANLPPRAQPELGDAGTRAVARDAQAAGRQLRALGVGMNLAPVADLAVAGGPAQGRAFSDDPKAVVAATRAAVAAYRRSGVAAVVGHFPGEGAAAQDPAVGPAPVGLGIEDLRAGDMAPFAAVARGRRPAQAIRMSNAIYVAYDSVTPATLLPDAVSELRRRLGFAGTIVSGDLVAATATTGGSVGEAAVAALEAGVDLLVVPGGPAEQDDAFRAVVTAVRRGDVKASRVAQALRRIAALRRATRVTRTPAPLPQG
jgi:beta-N-acetylhexosaminidase